MAEPLLADSADNDATVMQLGRPAAPASANKKSGPPGVIDRIRDMRNRLAELSLLNKLILGASALFMLIVVVAILWSSRTKNDYKVLFSNINERDGAAIVGALQQMNVPYRFTEGGAALMVPETVVHDTRLKLAGQGLPKSGTIGFELLENQKMGTSQFIEQINYQRGLEGELAKSITAISQVRQARVHLAVPKQTAFAREQQKPSASVVLALHPGRFLDEQQVLAITHLVSSSVPQLGPQNVTIVDSDGNMLAPNPSKSTPTGLDAAQMKYVAEVEASLAKRVAAILEPIAGKDNVRSQVTIDMDLSQQERAEETYRPNPPGQTSIRSQQSLEAQGPISAAGGIPGALSNQPPANAQAPIDAAPGADGAAPAANPTGAITSSAGRKEQTTNYEVDRTVQYTKGSHSSIRRVSAAVVVNYKNVIGKDGKSKAQPFTAQELQQMSSLVRDAMGYNEKRGDSVSVANIPFNVEPIEEIPFYKQPGVIEMTKDIGQYLVIAVAMGALFFVVVKPILFPPPVVEVPEDEQRMEEEFDEKIKAELSSMSPQARERRRLELELDRERRRVQEEEERIRIEEEKTRLDEERKRMEEEKTREYDELLIYAKDYVQQDPRVVAAIFKDWLAETKTPPKEG